MRQFAVMAKNTDNILLQLVGSKIREYRKSKKLSLQDLAYSIGMEKSNLSVIENGRSNPQLLTYAKIASALDISLKDLFDISFDFHLYHQKSGLYEPRKHLPKKDN
jgi:transcriptional regulator with XRE-family HTH domain